MFSTWSSNGKAKFSLIQKFGKEYIVCKSTQAQAAIRYVLDTETGVRKFPTDEQKQIASTESELIEMLVKSF